MMIEWHVFLHGVYSLGHLRKLFLSQSSKNGFRDLPPTRERKSCTELFYNKGVLNTLSKFIGKHRCRILFIKNETLARVFSCGFREIFKNTFLTEHPQATASSRGLSKLMHHQTCDGNCYH